MIASTVGGNDAFDLDAENSYFLYSDICRHHVLCHAQRKQIAWPKMLDLKIMTTRSIKTSVPGEQSRQ